LVRKTFLSFLKKLPIHFDFQPVFLFFNSFIINSHANDKIAHLNCYHVVTLDGSVSRATARDNITVSLQGNYDPAELIEENGKTEETVRKSATQLLQELGPAHLIANLGEGLGGKESTKLISVFVDTIHQVSEQMMKR
jgi:uroporphyrinogen decarboxylase